MDAELVANLGQRQAGFVELYGVINLDVGHGLTTHRRAGIAQKPEHAALAEPVPLRELSRRNASVVVGDEAVHGIGIEALRQLVAKPVSAFLATAFGRESAQPDHDAIDGNSGGILFRVASHQLHPFFYNI